MGVAKQDRGQREGRGKEKDSGSISDLHESCSAWPDEMPEGSNTFCKTFRHTQTLTRAIMHMCTFPNMLGRIHIIFLS